MKLFVMRHGEAEPHAATDSARQLTDSGRADIVQMATDYADDLAAVDVIWASPYVRAQQTAQLLSLQFQRDVITQDFLPPGGNPLDVLGALEAHKDQTVLIVSHQPLVGTLLDGLACLEPGRYRMGTGSLAYVSTDIYANGCCELRWLHQPASVQQPVYS